MSAEAPVTCWVHAGPGDNPSGSREHDEFLFGIDRILDGVQALIEQNRPS